MDVWIVLAAIASTAITALLTWVLYRLNANDGDGDGGSD